MTKRKRNRHVHSAVQRVRLFVVSGIGLLVIGGMFVFGQNRQLPSVLSATTSNSSNAPQANFDKTMPPWQDTPWKLYSTPYVGTTDIPASTIRVIPLSQGCQGPSPNEDLDVKLHQALLIEAPKPIFPDRMLLPEYFRYPDASYDMKRYLVLQGFFRRSTDPKSTSSQAYAVDLFRLIGPTFVRQPLQVGSTFIAPGSVSAFWEVYPIDNITQSFKVMYCNFEDPTFILLNFSGVTSFQARYEIAQGLIAN